MRLICPNCDAQYEVPAEVIPAEGRDVQCSNCGQTWYQTHPDHPEYAAPEPALEDEDVVTTDASEDVTEDPPKSDDAQHLAEPEPKTASAVDPLPDPEPDRPARRELDPAVANVLRAEAELEARARRQEAESFESQPDLGLGDGGDDEKRRARESRDRMARMRGEDAAGKPPQPAEKTPESAALGMGSRRDLLPDIEEINSTLRSNTDRPAAADAGQTAQIEAQEKRRSRLGFTLTVLLFAALALAYVFAAQISQAFPPAEPAMTQYATMVDGLRDGLDARLQAILAWLDDAASSSGQ